MEMASIASIFARTLTQAAGLELNETGAVLQNGKILYRLNGPTADKIPDCAYFELLDWLRLHTGDHLILCSAMHVKFETMILALWGWLRSRHQP